MMDIGPWWGISFPPLRPLGDEAKLRWKEVLDLGYIGMFLSASVLRSMLRGLSWGGNLSCALR